MSIITNVQRSTKKCLTKSLTNLSEMSKKSPIISQISPFLSMSPLTKKSTPAGGVIPKLDLGESVPVLLQQGEIMALWLQIWGDGTVERDLGRISQTKSGFEPGLNKGTLPVKHGIWAAKRHCASAPMERDAHARNEPSINDAVERAIIKRSREDRQQVYTRDCQSPSFSDHGDFWAQIELDMWGSSYQLTIWGKSHRSQQNGYHLGTRLLSTIWAPLKIQWFITAKNSNLRGINSIHFGL